MAESVDVVGLQEAQLGGHTYMQYIKEKLTDALISMKINILVRAKDEGDAYVITEGK